MKIRIALLAACFLVAPSILLAMDLDQQTLNAWDQYVQATNSQWVERAAGKSPFLWIDEAPNRRDSVLAGVVLAEPTYKDNPRKVPHGLIHDWVGGIFIPNATIQNVYSVLNDYARYAQFYRPVVVNAKLLEAASRKRTFSMEFAEKMPFVTAAIDGDYLTHTVRIDQHHWYTIISSTRIQQIDDYGRSSQHLLPPDQGTGYIWRLFAIQRFEERDGGVFAECEVIVLSRDVPAGLEWLVKPVLERLPRNAMEAALSKTKDEVCAESSAKANANDPLKEKLLAGSLAAKK